ncbi:MAG TPA: SSI family serine proteinase inhibitor [Streptosporangiaceae bacterium]|nr:SSI family serine proteinase inhibitor [Streptosporangiaceae bacterium]
MPGSTAAAITHRNRRGYLLFAAAVAGLVAVTGCGVAAAPGSGSASKAAKATLTLSLVNHQPGSSPKHWTLRCDPVGGTAPDPAATCKVLAATKEAFGPVKKNIMCPMILASSKQIVVSGIWYGHKVHRIIIDGECDIGLFNNLNKTFY